MTILRGVKLQNSAYLIWPYINNYAPKIICLLLNNFDSVNKYREHICWAVKL